MLPPAASPRADLFCRFGSALRSDAASGLPGCPARTGGDVSRGLVLPSAALRPHFPAFCPMAVGKPLCPSTAWGLSLGFFTRLSRGRVGSSCEPPKSVPASCGRTDPLCLRVTGAPVPADKEPLDCAATPGAGVPAHPPRLGFCNRFSSLVSPRVVIPGWTFISAVKMVLCWQL